MRLFSVLALFACMTAAAAETPPAGAVTYRLNSGRFGDNLLSFAHAAWFAYALDLPLVYHPFVYSDQLCMDDDCALLREDPVVGKTLSLAKADDYLKFYRLLKTEGAIADTLLEIPFYPESTYLFDEQSDRALFTQVNWKEPQFHARLRSWIRPKAPLPKLSLPANKISVALHYRTGEVYDKKRYKVRFPLKWPPDQFYIDCLNHLLAIEPQPLFVFIFTDSANPQGVKSKFEKLFDGYPVEFACRTEKAPEETVLEDFFALEEFECLIRPESHFSIMAEFLFPFRIVFSPAKFHWVDAKTITVDQILLEFNPPDMPSFRTTLR